MRLRANRARFGADARITLNGFRPLPPELRVDWERFFVIAGWSVAPQPSERIGTRLTLPLFERLRRSAESLAERKLRRGKALRLASGQAVVEVMGVTPLSSADLGLNDAGWGGQAPLWFYILKEAELQHQARSWVPSAAASSPRCSSGSLPRTA